MIELLTKCEDCIHKKVCKNVNNPKNAMNKLKNLEYSDHPNQDYDWDTMMNYYGVTIRFSCGDFRIGKVERK